MLGQGRSVWKLPEELFWRESCLICLVRRGGTTPERVADGEDTEPAEGVQGEEDEDGQGDEAPHHLLLQLLQFELSDGNVGVQMGHPARKLAPNLTVVLEEI